VAAGRFCCQLQPNQNRCISSCYSQWSFKSIQRNLASYLPHSGVDVLQLPVCRCLMAFEKTLSTQPALKLPAWVSDRTVSARISGRTSEKTLQTPVCTSESTPFFHLRQKKHYFARSQITAENQRTRVKYVLVQYSITKSYSRSYYFVFLIQCATNNSLCAFLSIFSFNSNDQNN